MSNQIKTIFEEVDRCDSIRQTLDVKKDMKTEANQESLKGFYAQIDSFFRGKSVDHYLDERLYDQCTIDPNSYLLVSFMPFNREQGETPECYPTLFSAQEVYQKQYDHKGLKYICFKTPVKTIENNGVKKVIYRYLLFTENHSYEVFIRADFDELEYDSKGWTGKPVQVKGQNAKNVDLIYRQFTHSSGRVPAVKLGYYETKIEEYLVTESHLLPAKHLFTEHIEKKSIYDNQVRLWGFIRAYLYAQRCEHKVDGKPCDGGKIGDTECPKCQGTGLKNSSKVATDEQDMVVVEMPLPNSNPEAGEIMDLSKLVHFVKIPIEVFEENRAELDRLTQAIAKSMFNTNIFNRSELVAGVTATEVKQRLKQVNNVLYKYAQHKAHIWRFVVEQIAIYHKLQNHMEISREYPSDFKLETVDELIAMLKSAKDAGATVDVIRKIENDILLKQYADQPEKILWIQSKNKFKPFYTKSDAEAMAAVALLSPRDPKRVLYVFFDDIFNEIESAERLKVSDDQDDTQHQPRFYEMNYTEQKAVVDNLVSEYTERIPEAPQYNEQPF